MAYRASPDFERASLGRVAWINVAVTVVASAVMVAGAAHLPWPGPADSAVAAVGAVVLLVLSAVATVVIAAVTLIQRRRWTWAVAAWLLVAICALGAAANARPTFDAHRLEFEEFARRLLHEPTNPQGGRYHRDVRIGRFDIAYAYASSDGSVYFHDARTGLSPSDNPGWIYAPNGLSEGIPERTGARHAQADWYTFSNLTVDDY